MTVLFYKKNLIIVGQFCYICGLQFSYIYEGVKKTLKSKYLTFKEDSQMTNYTLTTNQKELLKKGIAEEAAKDVRMHSGMEQETQQIFNNFINADTELMKQVSYNALLECSKY